MSTFGRIPSLVASTSQSTPPGPQSTWKPQKPRRAHRAVATPEPVLEHQTMPAPTETIPSNLNKYSRHITQPKSQGASQAMLYATGLTEDDMNKPQARRHTWLLCARLMHRAVHRPARWRHQNSLSTSCSIFSRGNRACRLTSGPTSIRANMYCRWECPQSGMRATPVTCTCWTWQQK